MNTCENHLVVQATYKALDRVAWQIETRIFPDAGPFELTIDDNLLYAHFWTAPPLEEIEKLKKGLISFTYCDRTYDLIGEYEPIFGHRPGRTKSLALKYQLEKSA